MEPKEVLTSRRDFFKKLPFAIGSSSFLGRALSGYDAEGVCPPKPELVLMKPSRIGINIPGDGTVDPDELASLGAKWVRFIAAPHIDTDFLKEYISKLHKKDIKILLLIVMESLENMDFSKSARMYAERYGAPGIIDAWQLGNEPDDMSGIWSWPLEKEKFARLMWSFRDAMPDVYLVAGGLDSGQPHWLEGVNLDWVNAVAIHPYGQGLPGWPSFYGFPGHIGLLIKRYKPYIKDKPIWITEWGINHYHFGEAIANEYIIRMMEYFGESEDVERHFLFCFTDRMDNGFGLKRLDGSLRPAYVSYKNMAHGVQTAKNTYPASQKMLDSVYYRGKSLDPHPQLWLKNTRSLQHIEDGSS